MSALAVLEEIHRADPQTDRLNLNRLDLSHLDDATLVFLRDRLSTTRHIELRGNALTCLPPDVGAFVPHLVALDVRDNPFTSIPDLSEALATCPALQSLHVTLHNTTDEKVLRVMLPKLRLLNGVSVRDSTRTTRTTSYRPSPLSLELPLSPTSCSSSSGGDSPSSSLSHRWLDTPPSTTARAVRPVRSPQEKRELRIHLASAQAKKTPTKMNTTTARMILTKPKAPSRVDSVRPTELPATISDEKTDWRKLLKQTTAKREQQTQPNDHVAAAVARHATDTTTTRSFIAELKAIVRGFQHAPTTTAHTDDHNVLEQLERKIDRLALQLTDLEKKPSTGGAATAQNNDGHVVTAALTARWRLVEAGTLYATHYARAVDPQLGTGLHRLLQTQTQVVEALLRHVHDAIYAQHKWHTASTSQQQVAEQQKQQMKLLLDVAETLEKDLEALQVKYEQEQTQRAHAQATTQSLQSECNDLKLQLLQQPKQQPTDSVTPDAGATQQRQTRIRTRHDVTSETKAARPAPSSPPSRKALAHQGGAEQAIATDASRSVSPPKLSTHHPAIVRSLTLKQLVDLIHCILSSKAKYDARLQAVGAPPETVEQHMYAYLNQRFGLQALTIEYAAAIWKGCRLYTRDDNDVAMFHALLRNQVDEDFVGIKTKLTQAVRELLRAFFHATYPLKAEPVIQKLVDARVLHGGLIYENEWTELLLYLYDPSDSSILMRLVKRKAEVFQRQQEPAMRSDTSKNSTVPPRPAATATGSALGLPFAIFEKLLYDYQLQGRLKLLESFRARFSELDSDRVGVLTRHQFRQLVAHVAPRKSDSEVHTMVTRIDAFDHDSITFSDAVRCLLPDIRQQSVTRRTNGATASNKATPAQHKR